MLLTPAARQRMIADLCYGCGKDLVRVVVHLIAGADRFAFAKEDLIKPHQLQYFCRSHFVRALFVAHENNRKKMAYAVGFVRTLHVLR